MLPRRGWFRFTGKLALRVGRQLVAVAAMAALPWWMMPRLADHYGGPVFERIWSHAALVGAGGAVFFAAAFLVGALDRGLLAILTRRCARSEAAPATEQRR